MSYKLTVISSGEPAMREVCRQLRNYLGPSFRIKGYYLGQLKGLPPIEDDLVLISAPSFARQIIPHIKPGVAYIMMRRTIDPERILSPGRARGSPPRRISFTPSPPASGSWCPAISPMSLIWASAKSAC